MKETGIYQITKLDDQTYAIDEGGLSTMYLLLGNTCALLIDAGAGAGDLKTIVEQLAAPRPCIFAASHAHVDHVGGRSQFDRLHVHPDDMSQVKKVTVPYRSGYAAVAVERRCKLTDFRFRPVEKEPALIPMEEHTIFDLGGRTVQVFHNPGHTLGSVSFLDVERGWLFGGDNFNPMLLLALPHAAPLTTYVENARRILRMDAFDTVIFSHDTALHTKEEAWRPVHCAQEILAQGKTGFGPAAHTKDGATILYLKNKIFSR